MQARNTENKRSQSGNFIDTPQQAFDANEAFSSTGIVENSERTNPTIFDELLSNGQIELLALAFSFLDATEQASASLVCKQWQAAMQSHLITVTDESMKFYMAIRITNSYIKTSFLKMYCARSDLEEAIKKRNFLHVIRSESDNKDDVVQMITLELDHLSQFGWHATTYFIAECTLKNNKLTIFSCDRICNLDSVIAQTFIFSSPIACDMRRIEPNYFGYAEKVNPEIKVACNLAEIEFNKCVQTFNDRKQAQLNTMESTKEPAASIANTLNFSQSSSNMFAKPTPTRSHDKVVEQRPSSRRCTLS